MLPGTLIAPIITKNNTLTYESNRDCAHFQTSEASSIRKRTRSSHPSDRNGKNEV